METRLFDYDPVTGRTRLFHYDHTNDTFQIETKQDVTDLVMVNNEIAKEDVGKFADGMHRVASIPMNIYFELQRKGILKDKERLAAWLNDPDNRAFRTKMGRV